MSAIASRVLSAGVLLVWAAVLLYFELSGRVANYLHPAFHFWTFSSAVVLAAMAAALLLTRPSDSDAPPIRWPARLFGTGVLVIPLLLATWISPSQFGATAVWNRGFVQDVGDLAAYQPPMDPPLPREDGSIGEGEPMNPSLYLPRNEKGQLQAEAIDLLYAAKEPTLRPDFENKEVEIIGQFLPARTGNADGDRFNLVRMFVLCCAADARPLAVTVKAAPGTSFPEMEWIKVTGRATFPVESGRHTPLVIADHIEPTEPPPETFLY
ncbi:MAG: TIGR03943 family protein [Terrimicrobiaceae bacterium]|nr:TIGR03943 family protein [Terrimicrobiaceae bacterium]